MNNIHLSKSKYCKCVQCEKIIWLKKYKEDCATELKNKTVFKNGKKIGELAKGYFGNYKDIPYNENLNIMVEKTQEYLKNEPVITEASFIYDNNFCSVDILKNYSDGVEIYEVKSSKEISDIYIDDASYQYYVLSNLGLNVKKVCIMYRNSEYIKGKLPVKDELDKFFIVKDITDAAKDKQNEIKNKISSINKFMVKYDEKNEPPMDIGTHCFNPYGCEFWEYCTRDLPKPNVFDVVDMNTDKKLEKYYEGKISFKDLENENMGIRFAEQVDFELNNREPKIDRKYIKEIIDSLKYPLYFIDYETYQLPIPELEGTKAYQALPFQYSLHIIKEEGAEVEHKEFLADIDDEDFIKHFAENMVKDLSEDGNVIIYSKYERTINNKILELYPQFKNEIERINSNMVDFWEIFKKRKYYTKEMKGSASIKDVLPALCPELDYHNLDLVHNGTEASNAFISLKNKSSEEQKETREALLKYCCLDTYAMVKIYEKFKEVLDE